MRTLLICTFILTLTLSPGCSKRPTGFPAVRPCSVGVTDGPLALEDVEITLIPAAPLPSVIFVGKTGADGRATLRTIFAGHAENGVPEGNYTVLLKKDPPTPHTKSEEARTGMDYDQAMKYDREMEIARNKLPKIIPVPLTENASPLRLLVEATGGTLEIDVSKYK